MTKLVAGLRRCVAIARRSRSGSGRLGRATPADKRQDVLFQNPAAGTTGWDVGRGQAMLVQQSLRRGHHELTRAAVAGSTERLLDRRSLSGSLSSGRCGSGAGGSRFGG